MDEGLGTCVMLTYGSAPFCDSGVLKFQSSLCGMCKAIQFDQWKPHLPNYRTLKDLLQTYQCQTPQHCLRGLLEFMPQWVRAILAAQWRPTQCQIGDSNLTADLCICHLVIKLVIHTKISFEKREIISFQVFKADRLSFQFCC